MKQKWHDKKWLVILLLVVFYPVGVYALWKGKSFSSPIKILFTVILTIFVSIIYVYGPETTNTSYQDKERAFSVLKSNYLVIQPNQHVFGRVGERVSLYDYVLRITAHIPEKYHYGWEVHKNPIGKGILIGYGTWAMTIDSTKFMKVIWLIDENNIVRPADLLSCMLMEEDVSNETLEIYENAFK